MGKSSRDKGNRFERKIAKLFSEAFNMNIRRVPLSGGLDIKSDLYCPEDDSFPYFVECKCHKSFRFDSLIDEKTKLFNFYDKNRNNCAYSYHSNKFKQPATPLLVFQGGDFKRPMVMFSASKIRIDEMDMPFMIKMDDIYITELLLFLAVCDTDKLKLKNIISQEDDGECD